MNHMCGRSSSDKDRTLNLFEKQSNTTDKNCCPVKRSTVDFKCANHYSKKLHRAKRLKSRKERSQMRGCGKEAPRSKSHHHMGCHRRSKETTYVNDCCCQSSGHCILRCDAPLLNVVPVTQEPSIITDSRLIGHHGLFNHEVKSIDIERLLSKQRKMEKCGQQVHKNNCTSHPHSTSHVPTPISSNDFLSVEVVTLEEGGEPAAEAHDDFQMIEDKISQGSDVIPGQKVSPVLSENATESQLTPINSRGNVMTGNQDSLVHQSQHHGVSKSPLELSSSVTPERSILQYPSTDPSAVSESVRAVAANLCGCLQLPVLRRRNLMAESREVLLKALQKRHGPLLQENLSQLQGFLSSGSDHTKEVQDQELTMIEEDELHLTDTFTSELRAIKPFFNTQKNKSFSRKGSEPNLWSSPLLLPNPEQTDEWFRRPEETSTSPLADILRPPPSAQFCMDFEPLRNSDHLFSASPMSCWEERNPQFPHPRDNSSRQISEETFKFDSFESRLMNQTRALIVPQYTFSHTQNFSPHQAQLQERRLTESINFPREMDPFAAERYGFASSSSSQVQHPDPVQSFQPFSQISRPSACPPLRPHRTDMIHYPPSHMLEREPASSRSSLLSPEHWTFPPMRLY